MEAIELSDGVVSVRTPTEADAATVVDAIQSSVHEVGRWLPFATPDYGIDDALAWITGEIDPGHPLVIVAPGGRIVGTTGLNQLNETNQLANLGYWLRTDATGHGYATRATRLVARYGIQRLGLRRVEILMAVGNEASKKVAERAGAHFEGTLRDRLLIGDESHDAHVFSFVRGDFD